MTGIGLSKYLSDQVVATTVRRIKSIVKFKNTQRRTFFFILFYSTTEEKRKSKREIRK